MKTLKLKENLYWAGILDKDLRVFDIIMMTEFGTTYNSYVLKAGDKTVLFETAKGKYDGEYQKTLAELVDTTKIDYVVVSHTEPDHAGCLATIVDLNPEVEVIGTAVAISYLKNIVNKEFKSIAVKNGDEMNIGGKTLRFFPLPNLHWPDSMYTYLVEDKALFTCDSFGSHYAHDEILRSTVTDTEGYMRATKYYFDNIIGPFKNPFMEKAMAVVRGLDLDLICTGHGPVLDSHIEELLDIYDGWCAVPAKGKKKVVIPYVSAYGYTAELAETIAEEIKKAGDFQVDIYDMVTADQGAVVGEMASADGILLGTPTILQTALKPILDLTNFMTVVTHKGKLGGAFGSYGWTGEGVPMVTQRLEQLKLKVVEGYRIKFKPSAEDLEGARAFARDFASKL